MLNNYIMDYDNILIMAHKRPDGDAIGSVLAMYLYLKEQGKKVSFVLDEYAKSFSFFLGIMDQKEKIEDIDLVIALDTSSMDRLSHIDLFKRAKHSIGIDHHPSNTKYCDHNFVYDMEPATCQILYYLFKENNIDVSKEIGICLMNGLVTDTNGFRVGNLTSKSYEMIYELSKIGVDVKDICNRTVVIKTKKQFSLLNRAMDRTEFFDNDRIAYTYLKRNDLEELNAELGDHEGIVDMILNIEGIEVAIFLMDSDDGVIASLRSCGNVNVAKVASIFAGGGHVSAAGFTIKMEMAELKDKLIMEIEKDL